ncbi:molybdopterin dinucleotide binding domain-containing protein [Nocardia sp. NPDC001965]
MATDGETDTSARRCVSYCRLCASSCGVLLDIEDGRITRVLGDAQHPISGGYACPKGRRAGDLVHGPDRLTSSLRRTGTGAHTPVPVAAAVDEIAQRLRGIVDRHGPDAVALYMGTQQNFAALTPLLARAWFRGTGSHKLFSTMTIDQSAKWVVADEILAPGPDRVRALIVSGGNPAVALPGRAKTLRALRSLDLLVCVDPRLSDTARLADYVIAPTTMYERADHTAIMEPFFPRPFAQYTPAVLDPPPGTIDDRRFFFGLAVASGQPVKFAGRILDPDRPPTSDQLLAMMTERGRVPFGELTKAPHGRRADIAGAVVGPPVPGAAGHRLRSMPGDVRAELRAALGERVGAERFPLRLTVRRIREAVNSTGVRVPGPVPGATNPAALHPDDLTAYGLVDGAAVIVRGAAGRVRTTVRADETVARGTVTMTHCFGSLDPDEESGVNVNALTGTAGAQAINAMPTLTAVPVAVEPAPRTTPEAI